MVTIRFVCWAAVVTLVAGGLADVAAAQDSRPSAGNMAQRLRDRGIQIAPEQMEQIRKIVEDLRNGVEPDPEQIQKVADDIRKQLQTQAQARIKEELGATDEEWKVLGPKIEKVQDLTLQNSNVAMALTRMGLGYLNIGGDSQDEVQKKLQALQELLKKKDVLTEDILKALKEYRDARDKARAELVKARAELRELLTLRQEGKLVTMGLLE